MYVIHSCSLLMLQVKLVKTLPETNADGTTELPKTDIFIKIDNFEEGYYYQWPEGKFNDRVFMMRDLLEEYFESEEIPQVTRDNDPFWDPPEPQLIGQSFMALKNLGYLVDNELDAKILSSEGSSGVRGNLKVRYCPTDDTGEGEPDEDLLPEEPEDLLGKAITFKVEIDGAKELPKDLCKNVFVSYGLNFDKSRSYQTEEVEGKSQNPSFNFTKLHHVDSVTPSILRYLANGQMCFKVYGYPDFDMARKNMKKEIEESKKTETKKDDAKTQVAQKAESK